MGPLVRRTLATRAALYGVLAIAVAAVGIRAFGMPIGAGMQILGDAAPLLILAVALALGASAALEFAGRTTAATVTMAGLAFFAGPTFAYAYADPAAAIFGPLAAFVLVSPHMRRGWPLASVASIAVLMMVLDVVLLTLRARVLPQTSYELVNAIVSVAAGGGLMAFLTVAHRRELETTAANYAGLFNGLPIAAFRTTPDGGFLAVNEAMLRLYGYRTEEELRNRPLTDSYANPIEREGIWKTVAEAGAASGEIEIRRPDGSNRWVRYQLRGQRDQRGSVTHVEGVAEDISAERKMAAWRQQREEIGAALKGLSPDASVGDLAAAVCRQIATSPQFRYAGIFSIGLGGAIHLEGGSVGDRRVEPQPIDHPGLARAFADRLPWGPYVDVVKAPTSDVGRRAAAAGVSDVAYLPLVVENIRVGVLVAGTGTGDRQLLTEHLGALGDYAAVATSLLAPGLMARRRFDRAGLMLRGVIDGRAFHPVFQPIVTLEGRKVIGYEALTRFDDGTPPDMMFRIAREAGMEIELESVTLEAAMGAAPRLRPGLFLSVNASPDLIRAVEPLKTHVAKWSDRVVVELTEHAEVADYDRLRQAITALGPHVVLAVDDAGAGFASLRHILELSPRFVKLDREFVRDVDSDPARRALAASMAHFSRETGMTLIAEGVETEAEAATLQRLGVPAAQGFLFGRPLRGIARASQPVKLRLASRGPTKPRGRHPKVARVA